MNDLFIRILNVGISGGWIALGVLLLRPLLKKTPRWVLCLLWALVALRLLVPYTLYSPISLQPSSQVIPTNITTAPEPAINSGISAINEAVNPILTEIAQPQQNRLEQLLWVGVTLWLAGLGLIVLYSAFTYLRLRYKVRVKLGVEKRVYICDDLDSPFILGVVFPKIYLPSTLSEQQRTDVLCHEYAHLKRRDHWWKPLGFLLLAVYWFNPLLWVAYILLCRDIEQACDEKVIGEMSPVQKTHYAQTLLQCSVRRYMIAACPVAFGEVSVKRRIKGILSYKHPGFWVLLLSFVACAVVAVCFLTDPLPCKHDYSETVLSAPGCTETGRTKLSCKKCDHSYVRRTPVLEHRYEDGDVLTQPTCTSFGVRNRVCIDCGQIVTAKIEMTPHRLDDGGVQVQPTCTSTGVRNHVCLDCGTTVTTAIEMSAHIPGECTVTEPATCSKEGVATTNCAACGTAMTVSVPVDPENHNMQETVIFRNTCKSLGKSQFTCQLCGHEEIRFYQPNEHQLKLLSKQEGTCTSRGWELYGCQICSYEGIRFIEKPGSHQLELVSRTEPTCTTAGKEHYNCKTCGEQIEKTISATGHKNELVSRTEPTCSVTGEAIYKCQICGSITKTVLYCISHHFNDEDVCVVCGYKVTYMEWG